MKKNLMTVIILALVFANFVLSAIMMFTILPQTQKANEMIKKVCEAIDLELNSGAATGLSNLPVSQIEVYDVAEGDTMTVNLADGSYAVISIAISVNNQSEEYEEGTTTPLSTKESLIKDAVREIVGKYTKDELNASSEAAKAEILKILKQDFGAEYVVGVSFPVCTLQ